ncbi:NADH-quinone oxidoreductase subunit C/D [Aliiglaciecola sp. CAU 1673]|uniref:NADH-quinone oxidoreductase subunit C/D n=1 Tax=Aliiglaciecola sp. CAU 1673 TaxID=3032595 RepID=UPI0023DC7549|nr:NADH-quinone oxidoreductase subunit C/D [Aliiglaciecola sp. CAU 1673]MDF2176649.1 NADH-quinone oxidoreductase subunit C/D [Aliiglaciecola sp. CAU 1673]
MADTPLPLLPQVQVLSKDFAPELESSKDGVETWWITKEELLPLCSVLKNKLPQPFDFLYDLTAIDETRRKNGAPQRQDLTLVYLLRSYARNQDLRLKIALRADLKDAPSLCSVWPCANWYEREVWDLFGIRFDGHPCLRRIMMPSSWQGHPLLKTHPARATEMGPFSLPDEVRDFEQESLRFDPKAWGLKPTGLEDEFMWLNLGPNHPSVHGVFRIMLQLDGEAIRNAIPDIGYHHRGAEKMAERQSWHSYIPYTDRIDYLGGVMNNLPYVMALERLGGIEVPERAKVIRVMMAEIFRILSHLLFYGTFAQDVGALSPIFYMFVDREKLFGIVEAITGARMHPSWFRIGGVANDLPNGWDKMILTWLDEMPKRLRDYDKMVLANRILRKRTVGVGAYDSATAIEWGVTGPGLRATGFDWDLRKARPYSGYEQFEFDVPLAQNGDCYDRCLVRVEEIRQSMRIIRQCVENMPGGPYKADHVLTTPPPKDRTMEDIDTLIPHFLGVSWGPVIPAGEVHSEVEATKGSNAYYVISDGGNMSYRTHIRTPSFPHLQMIPVLAKGQMVADLIATIGSIDFVMADVDR